MLSVNKRTRAKQLARRERLCVTLESGNYKQTTGMLRSKNDRCCCLGVAADLVAPRGWRKRSGEHALSWNHSNGDKMPSLRIKELYGFSESQASELASNNDAGKSFPEIAAMIRGLA